MDINYLREWLGRVESKADQITPVPV
ncbi:MAG: hypothetical protein V7642_1217, partial [Burkholderiales bacterium]